MRPSNTQREVIIVKKKVFTALQVLGNAAGIVSGAVAMQYSSEIKGMGTGSEIGRAHV